MGSQSPSENQPGTQAAEARLNALSSGSAHGLWDWRVADDEFWFSQRALDMLGAGEDPGFAGDMATLHSRVHPEDLARLREAFERHLQAITSTLSVECRLRRVGGGYRWFRMHGQAVRGEHATPLRIAGSIEDITERRKADELQAHRAWHDELTGLPNRAMLQERLRIAFERGRRQGASNYALLFVDLDRFKYINDSLGHHAGDELLRGIGRRIEGTLRSTDCVARLGGDEFAVLIEDLQDEGEALQVAERIRHELAEPFVLEGQEVFTTASVGVVLASAHYLHAAQLLRDADTALFHAKGQGRSCHAVFTEAMREEVVATFHLDSHLRRAVERQEFEPYFQKIVRLSDRQVCGFEALVRWHHPERGLLPPGSFLGLAEETGLDIPLGEQVLHAACRQLRDWHENPALRHLYISVNLSPAQFRDRELPVLIQSVLQSSDLAPSSLRLEITEGILMDRPEQVFTMFMRLRNLGVRLSIDDFGTGFSSLSYLHQFPQYIQTLKIDQSFVSRMHIEIERAEVVRTITMLAHNLGLETVAEGIEHRDQIDQLIALGCQYGQGFYFGRPMPVSQLGDPLQTGDESASG